MERPRDKSGRGDGGRSRGEGGRRIGVRSINGLMAGLTSMSSKETGLATSLIFVLPSFSLAFIFILIPLGGLFFFFAIPPPLSDLVRPPATFPPLFLFCLRLRFLFLFLPSGLFIAGEREPARSGDGDRLLFDSLRLHCFLFLRDGGVRDRVGDSLSFECGDNELLYEAGDGSEGVLGLPLLFFLLNTGDSDVDLDLDLSDR